MNDAAMDHWSRATDALRVAKHDLELSADAAASRAYYAAFHAVCSLLAMSGATFERHTAVEAAVHRDLVRVGKWSADLGKGYTWLFQLRSRADYGGGRHASCIEASEAIEIASAIVNAVSAAHPEVFILESHG